MNSCADRSLTVKNVCFDYPNIYGRLFNIYYYLIIKATLYNLFYFQTTVKSLLGKIRGAIKVQMYSNVVDHAIICLTQKPKSFELRSPVIMLAEVQFVMSMPTYIEAIHIFKCHFTQDQDSYFSKLPISSTFYSFETG